MLSLGKLSNFLNNKFQLYYVSICPSQFDTLMYSKMSRKITFLFIQDILNSLLILVMSLLLWQISNPVICSYSKFSGLFCYSIKNHRRFRIFKPTYLFQVHFSSALTSRRSHNLCFGVIQFHGWKIVVLVWLVLFTFEKSIEM